jgi:hypothetical protein
MPVLEWPEPKRSSQYLDVLLKSKWSFNVAPRSLPEFVFKGQCTTGPLEGADVYSEFKKQISLQSDLPDPWSTTLDLANTRSLNF